MARVIRTRRREALPGGGFDSSGNPKQGKRKVVGALAVTSYTSAGESLTPADIGLSVIDFIRINHTDEAANAEGRGSRWVNYVGTTSDFYIMQQVGATEVPATGSTHSLQFSAEGDALDGIELT